MTGHFSGPAAPVPPTPQGPRPLIIIGIVLLALVVIGVPVAGVVIIGNWTGHTSSPRAGASTPSRSPVTLDPGDHVTEEALRQVSPDDFYWHLLSRQMTNPVSLITQAYFSSPEEFTKHDSYTVKQVGSDHRAGPNPTEMTAAATYYLDGKSAMQIRCFDGTGYHYYEDDAPRQEWIEDSSMGCQLDDPEWRYAISDGIAPAGLSQDQCRTMITALRDEYAGFTNPRPPILVTTDSDDTYIRQIVDFQPIKSPDTDHYEGPDLFLSAFRKTGLDFKTWPFSPGWLREGEMHVVYYLNPNTLLPVATMLHAAQPYSRYGSVKKGTDETEVFNYQFPAELTPLNRSDFHPLPLLLPEGWQIPS